MINEAMARSASEAEINSIIATFEMERTEIVRGAMGERYDIIAAGESAALDNARQQYEQGNMTFQEYQAARLQIMSDAATQRYALALEENRQLEEMAVARLVAEGATEQEISDIRAFYANQRAAMQRDEMEEQQQIIEDAGEDILVHEEELADRRRPDICCCSSISSRCMAAR